MGRFFEPFLFEELPAKDISAQQAYLAEVADTEVYLGLFGVDYGYEDAEGVSTTEREYDCATENHKYRIVLIKRAEERHPKEMALIKKAEQMCNAIDGQERAEHFQRLLREYNEWMQNQQRQQEAVQRFLREYYH